MAGQEADYCKCPTPECRVCGLVVRDQRQPAEGIIEEECLISDTTELQTIVCDGLGSIIDTPHIARGCSRLHKSYLEKYEDLDKELSSIQSGRDKVHFLCTKVGLDNVAPLIELLQMLSIHIEDKVCLAESLKRLQSHEAMVTGPLMDCQECTAPSEGVPSCIKSGLVGFADSRSGTKVSMYALYTTSSSPEEFEPP